RRHAAALTAAAEGDKHDVVLDTDQVRVPTVGGDGWIDVVLEHGLDLSREWIGGIELPGDVDARRLDHEPGLERIVTEINRRAIHDGPTLSIHQHAQP